MTKPVEAAAPAGFGSFVAGANGAVDYNTISGSSNYNAATAVGTDTFQVSLNGEASNANAIAVDLTQGDATAASVTGTDNSASPISAITSNKQPGQLRHQRNHL
jgi:hypothetical protein